MSTDQPSTLDKLAAIAAIAGKAELYIPVAGQYIHIANVALHQLAAFLDTSGADKSALDAAHAEYQRRIKIANDPNS